MMTYRPTSHWSALSQTSLKRPWMSGLASIDLFLFVQTVRKTIGLPVDGSRTGKWIGVLRCARSFIIVKVTRSDASAFFIVFWSVTWVRSIHP